MAQYIKQFTEVNFTTVSDAQQQFSASNCVLLSHEQPLVQPDNADYILLQDVGTLLNYYSPTSRTYKMAYNILTNPEGNISMGNGNLAILYNSAIASATQPIARTQAITDTILRTLLTITDGSLKFKLNGITKEEFSVSGLNFSGFTTLAQIVKYLDRKIPYLTFDVGVGVYAGEIIITGHSFGTSATIQFEESSIGTDLSGVTYLNIPLTVHTGSEESEAVSTLQTLLTKAINSFENNTDFKLFTTTVALSQAQFMAFATHCQTTEKVFLHSTFGTDVALVNGSDGILPAISSGGINQSFITAFHTKELESVFYGRSCEVGYRCQANYVADSQPRVEINGKSLNVNQDIVLFSKKSIAEQPMRALIDDYITQIIANGGSFYCATGGASAYKDAQYSLPNGSKFTMSQKLLEVTLESYFNYYNLTLLQDKARTLLFDDTTFNTIETTYNVPCNILLNNNILTTYDGTDISTSVSILPNGASAELKALQLSKMQNRGYYVYATPIASLSSADKQSKTAKISILLNSPAGLQKIILNGKINS